MKEPTPGSHQISDDYEYSAHKAMTGITDLGTVTSQKQVQKPLIQEIDAGFGSNCYKEPNKFRQMCDAGFVKVGADRDGVDCKGIVSEYQRSRSVDSFIPSR